MFIHKHLFVVPASLFLKTRVSIILFQKNLMILIDRIKRCNNFRCWSSTVDLGRGDVPRKNQMSCQRYRFLHVLAGWIRLDQVIFIYTFYLNLTEIGHSRKYAA